MCRGRPPGPEPREDVQGSVASPPEVRAARGPRRWFFPAALGCSGQLQRKRVAGFNQGRSLLAGCDGKMEGYRVRVLPEHP